MGVHYRYLTTDEDPSIAFRLLDRARNAIDMSAVSAWSVYVVNATTDALRSTVTSGLTGYAALQGTAPHDYNVILQWASGALATIGAGRWKIAAMQVTIGGRQRSFGLADPVTFEVKAVPS